MVIITDMNVTDVTIYGILQHLIQNHVQGVLVNLHTGINLDKDNMMSSYTVVVGW